MAAAVAPVVHESHKSKGVKASVKKMLSTLTSLIFTTVMFAVMLFITLTFDKFVVHYLFVDYAVGADPVLVYMFKGAKYLALFVELAFWVYGVYKECKHHSEE
ncbi:hypothetical protein WJ84_03905 [Burkholderia ubonensis]|nr:hypothetical protein WJ84_03905 [Burkholderia ubonensis]